MCFKVPKILLSICEPQVVIDLHVIVLHTNNQLAAGKLHVFDRQTYMVIFTEDTVGLKYQLGELCECKVRG
jgi:hypothetical protein